MPVAAPPDSPPVPPPAAPRGRNGSSRAVAPGAVMHCILPRGTVPDGAAYHRMHQPVAVWRCGPPRRRTTRLGSTSIRDPTEEPDPERLPIVPGNASTRRYSARLRPSPCQCDDRRRTASGCPRTGTVRADLARGALRAARSVRLPNHQRHPGTRYGSVAAPARGIAACCAALPACQQRRFPAIRQWIHRPAGSSDTLAPVIAAQTRSSAILPCFAWFGCRALSLPTADGRWQEASAAVAAMPRIGTGHRICPGHPSSQPDLRCRVLPTSFHVKPDKTRSPSRRNGVERGRCLAAELRDGRRREARNLAADRAAGGAGVAAATRQRILRVHWTCMPICLKPSRFVVR
jgi:hypothetical protein